MKTRKSKKLKGGISENNFHTLRDMATDIVRKTVSMKEMKDIIKIMNELDKGISPIDLSDRDWRELIAECYFRDNIYFHFDDTEHGQRISKLFDYETPDSFSQYQGNIVTDRPRSVSVTRSHQGTEGTCFAHAATLMIFHNMYRLPLTPEEEKVYLKNNCNLHLDTTKEVEKYDTLQYRCGKNGAARILLFLYIYKLITKRFGCHAGNGGNSINYYLTTPFQPIFPEMEVVLKPLYMSVNKSQFELSIHKLSDFIQIDWHNYLLDYFKTYYAVLYIENPPHEVTLVRMNAEGILGKDSASSSLFIIPYDQFHPKGTFVIEGTTFTGLSDILLLMEKEEIKNEK